MKVALLQYDIKWENKQANYSKIKELLNKIKGKDVDLVVLPELCATGFTMNPKPLEQNLNGPTPTFLKQLAKEHNVAILGTFIEQTTNDSTKNLTKKPKNSAVIINPKGEILLHYSKIHLFTKAGEDKHYTPGNESKVIEFKEHKIGVAICYDLRFPNLFQNLSQKGATCIFVIANWPKMRINHWDTLCKARAIENQSYIAAVNVIGNAPTIEYNGHTQVINPWGEVIKKTNENQEEVLIVDIDLESVKEARSKIPILKDKKPLSFWQ